MRVKEGDLKFSMSGIKIHIGHQTLTVKQSSICLDKINCFQTLYLVKESKEIAIEVSFVWPNKSLSKLVLKDQTMTDLSDCDCDFSRLMLKDLILIASNISTLFLCQMC